MNNPSLKGLASAMAMSATFLALPSFGADLDAPAPPPQDKAPDSAPASPVNVLERVEVSAQARRLNDARTGIQTQTGASTYTFTADAIAAMPGGDNTLLNQVLLQAPEVAQDSFGQFHVRGEHDGLQYRLDGVILPEGIAVFGQSLDPRLISSISLVTGALPAEYGLRTAGIIDIKTKSGALDPEGVVSIYGGSHGTIQPSFSYGDTSGRLHYFISADVMRNDLGIESPDGSSTPLHDHTTQTHGFGYLEYLLDRDNRLAFGAGTSVGQFQIPNTANLQPTLGLNVNGQTSFESALLNENQKEVTDFAFLSYQHSHGPLDWQTSLVSRYSTLDFTPDPVGDLLFNGISQSAYKRNSAAALQSDAAYKLDDAHTLRAGLFLQRDNSLSNTTSQVMPLDANGNQIGTAPVTIVDNGNQTEWIGSLYLQDEWKLRSDLTFNYGLRYDRFSAYSSGDQLSPRLNMVWQLTPSTTIHGGYSSYFSPPPFELVGSQSIDKFLNTSAAPAVVLDDTSKAERANYIDLGLDQNFGDGLSGGIDTYYKTSRDLIDEGQFGAPIILTPFNYANGRQYGAEFKLNYAGRKLSAYANLAFQTAIGTRIESAQFNFSAQDLNYIASHYIDLDHEQKITGSAGVSYLWRGTRFSADALLASGLRANLSLPNGGDIPNGQHLPYYTTVNLGLSHAFDIDGSGPLTVRIDVINAFDRVYQIRNGTGVGVGAPQFGARRGLFAGLSQSF